MVTFCQAALQANGVYEDPSPVMDKTGNHNLEKSDVLDSPRDLRLLNDDSFPWIFLHPSLPFPVRFPSPTTFTGL